MNAEEGMKETMELDSSSGEELELFFEDSMSLMIKSTDHSAMVLMFLRLDMTFLFQPLLESLTVRLQVFSSKPK